MREPCGWDVEVCESCCTDALDGMDPAVRAVLEQAAVRILWAATGKRYGLCETTLRPCRKNCGSYWGGLPTPTRVSGEWLNIGCGTCAGACGCSVLSEFTADDVYAVLGITVDGEELVPEETVVVYDRRRVVRVDGDQWPACQNLGAETGEGTWAVTILQGQPVPAGGDVMAGLLLCELAKACVGDDSCRLPKRMVNIARQGVTVAFGDITEHLDTVRTGLFEVDLWIEAARTTIGSTASISSVDRPKPAVMTWPLPEGSI